MEPLIAIALVWGAAAVAPGPDFLVIAHASAAGSRRRGLATVLGIACGTVIWGAAGFFGISALFALAPWLFAALKLAGGGYLVYLGLRLLWAARRSAPPVAGVAAGASAREGGLAAAWARGLMTNLANPKTAIFTASVFAAMLPADPSVALGAATVATIAGVSLVWYLIVALVLSSGPARRLYGRCERAVLAFAGGLFVLFGLRLAAAR